MTVLKVQAHHDTRDTLIPWGVSLSAEFPAKADAIAFVARFPKARKLIATTLTKLSDIGTVYGYACHSISLQPNGSVGNRNETGIARYRAIMKDCVKLGVEIEWVAPFGNSYQTREDFERAIQV